MERSDVILIAGIIAALAWLGACLILKGKKRKYAIVTGIIIDIVLFIICRSVDMLFIGVLGGVFCGFFGFFYRANAYKETVKEMKGVGNWVVVCIIFFVMLFMIMCIAYPMFKNIAWK